MIFYYSSIRAWIQHMVRARGFEPYAPLPDNIVALPHSFPSFSDFYNDDGRVRKLPTLLSKSVILDSGAHHFFNLSGHSVHPGASGTSSGHLKDYDLNYYVQLYIAFIKHNWDAIDYFIEFDVGDIFGMSTVHATRKEFQDAGIWEKCIGGWHRVNGWDDYEFMLSWPSKFVALQGKRMNEPLLNYGKLIGAAYERGVKVHVFALTDPRLLKRIPAYSTDSTSWMAPDRYGLLRKFDQRTGHFRVVYTGKANKFKSERHNVNPVIMMPLYDQLIYAINDTLKAQEWFTNYWRRKGILWREKILEHGGIYDDDRPAPSWNDSIDDPAYAHPQS